MAEVNNEVSTEICEGSAGQDAMGPTLWTTVQDSNGEIHNIGVAEEVIGEQPDDDIIIIEGLLRLRESLQPNVQLEENGGAVIDQSTQTEEELNWVVNESSLPVDHDFGQTCEEDIVSDQVETYADEMQVSSEAESDLNAVSENYQETESEATYEADVDSDQETYIHTDTETISELENEVNTVNQSSLPVETLPVEILPVEHGQNCMANAESAQNQSNGSETDTAPEALMYLNRGSNHSPQPTGPFEPFESDRENEPMEYTTDSETETASETERELYRLCMERRKRLFNYARSTFIRRKRKRRSSDSDRGAV